MNSKAAAVAAAAAAAVTAATAGSGAGAAAGNISTQIAGGPKDAPTSTPQKGKFKASTVNPQQDDKVNEPPTKRQKTVPDADPGDAAAVQEAGKQGKTNESSQSPAKV